MTQRMNNFLRVSILLACRKHLYDRLNSLTGDIWAHKTSLIPPLFIEVLVPSQKSKRSCICVLWVSILPLSTIFGLDSGFWNCSESTEYFVFHFYDYLLQTLRFYFLFLVLIMCTCGDLSIILPPRMNQIYT
jgi:hypothetical protein